MRVADCRANQKIRRKVTILKFKSILGSSR